MEGGAGNDASVDEPASAAPTGEDAPVVEAEIEPETAETSQLLLRPAELSEVAIVLSDAAVSVTAPSIDEGGIVRDIRPIVPDGTPAAWLR